jgi:hypothetical protein
VVVCEHTPLMLSSEGIREQGGCAGKDMGMKAVCQVARAVRKAWWHVLRFERPKSRSPLAIHFSTTSTHECMNTAKHKEYNYAKYRSDSYAA